MFVIISVTKTVCQTKDVWKEFAKLYAIMMKNVEMGRYAKIEFVKLAVEVILFVPKIKLVSTNNVEVGKKLIGGIIFSFRCFNVPRKQNRIYVQNIPKFRNSRKLKKVVFLLDGHFVRDFLENCYFNDRQL